MRKVKNTLVAVTANWCGACHSISDRLDNAIKNSMNATRIDETLLDKFNNTLKTSIEPPHFPYFIVINQSGKMVKVLRDIDAVEEFLENASNENANVNNVSMSTSALNKNINSVINNNSSSLRKNNVNSLLVNNNVKSLVTGNNNNNSNNRNKNNENNENNENNNEKMNSVMNSINESVKKSFMNNNGSVEVEVEEDEEMDMDPNKISIVPDNTGLPMKMESVGVPNVGKGPSASLLNVSNVSNASNASNASISNSMKSATRPNANSDARINAINSVSANQAGGCLYESLAASSSQLAAPAILLGLAAATLSKKKSRKTKRRSRSA